LLFLFLRLSLLFLLLLLFPYYSGFQVSVKPYALPADNHAETYLLVVLSVITTVLITAPSPLTTVYQACLGVLIFGTLAFCLVRVFLTRYAKIKALIGAHAEEDDDQNSPKIKSNNDVSSEKLSPSPMSPTASKTDDQKTASDDVEIVTLPHVNASPNPSPRSPPPPPLNSSSSTTPRP
jgi:hypothetical protein